ncbi:MAG TPA: hypothetical protein DCL61_27620 [Cyanobacteria bacterium UBA12227]|nr:hypothetical protein [Cyanobacteria bacterium UBA12227]HAX84829.1 hypothetical protein [Cyanobacteria bacterium UBA11370]HBY80921.1 hypothetical protein [Cyanobacteria bacterium UBA11148]
MNLQFSQIFCIMNFEKYAVKFSPPLHQLNLLKILDSSNGEQLGSNSSLPEQLQPEQLLTINPLSFVSYGY